MRKNSPPLIFLSLFFVMPALASATTISDILCNVLIPVWNTLFAAGSTLVVIMFIYGGIKYVFSSDDPGGRKEGKSICMQAIIAGILIVVTGAMIRLIGSSLTSHICAGITY